MEASCLAMSTASWEGATTMVVHSRTRSVRAAAADSSTTQLWLGYVIRSGTARLDHGPSSMARHQARVSARSWASIVGRVMAICIGVVLPLLRAPSW